MLPFSLDPTLCNPLEYLVHPGSYVYRNAVEYLYRRHHTAKDWHRVAAKVPVFDSISLTDEYGELSKHLSLFKENYYADSMLVSCKRGYRYWYDSATHLPVEIRWDERAVWLRKGRKDSVLYDGYPRWRTFCFYDDSNRLTGILNQRCDFNYDAALQGWDSSRIGLRSDVPRQPPERDLPGRYDPPGAILFHSVRRAF